MHLRFNTSLASLILAIVLSTNAAQGAVSYLLIQGNFDGVAGMESSRWAVTYDPSFDYDNDPDTNLTGFDLLNFVLGTPSLVSGSNYQTAITTWAADGTTWQTNYTKFSIGYQMTTQTITTSSLVTPTSLTINPALNLGWNYYVAGGGGDYSGAAYNSSTWSVANDGMNTRTLANGSFDAWVFGTTEIYGPPPDYEYLSPADPVVGFTPDSGSFTGAMVVAAAPEPSRSILLILAGIALVTRRNRTFNYNR
ncbi:hypothetical protein BH11VER1_BH11VER1_14000 [soil metagenome]